MSDANQGNGFFLLGILVAWNLYLYKFIWNLDCTGNGDKKSVATKYFRMFLVYGHTYINKLSLIHSIISMKELLFQYECLESTSLS